MRKATYASSLGFQEANKKVEKLGKMSSLCCRDPPLSPSQMSLASSHNAFYWAYKLLYKTELLQMVLFTSYCFVIGHCYTTSYPVGKGKCFLLWIPNRKYLGLFLSCPDKVREAHVQFLYKHTLTFKTMFNKISGNHTEGWPSQVSDTDLDKRTVIMDTRNRYWENVNA